MARVVRKVVGMQTAKCEQPQDYNPRMSFRIDGRHWLAFLLLFMFNIAALLFTVHRSGMALDSRTLMLMIACSALIAALTALLLVFLLDKVLARAERSDSPQRAHRNRK